MSENKIKYGLKNVHIAKQTETTDSAGNISYSYGTPQKWPGAVSISFDAQGGLSPFFADDTRYYVTYSMTGYEGDFESALIPQWVSENIFGDTMDANGVLHENNSAQPAHFALLFEFDGDARKTRHVLYNCTLTRPTIGSATKEEEAEPQTETATISASPRQDGSIHAKTTEDTGSGVYNGWYSAVYESPATAMYTVTFQSNGGTAVPSQAVASGGKVTEPDPAPTRTGKTFGGWYEDPEFTDAWTFSTDTVAANMTLYAKWT